MGSDYYLEAENKQIADYLSSMELVRFLLKYPKFDILKSVVNANDYFVYIIKNDQIIAKIPWRGNLYERLLSQIENAILEYLG